MPDFTVIVTAEFAIYADNLFDAVEQVSTELKSVQLFPMALRLEVAKSDV
jgi:hypothetical protein